MPDLSLTRSRDDRRLYELDGVGTLRFERGLGARRATARAGDRTWRMKTSFWRRAVAATDEAGAVVGTFDPRALRRGGALRWGGRELQLRPASAWRERYALADGDRELALLDARTWGKQPVRISIEDLGDVEPALLLFAIWVVRMLAHDSAAAGGTAAATG